MAEKTETYVSTDGRIWTGREVDDAFSVHSFPSNDHKAKGFVAVQGEFDPLFAEEFAEQGEGQVTFYVTVDEALALASHFAKLAVTLVTAQVEGR